MAGTGGTRPGAGRPRNQDRYAEPLATAADHLAASLPEVAEALVSLAIGAIPEEKWVLAGLVTRKDVLRVKRPPDLAPDAPFDDVWTDEKGKPAIVDVPLFPNLPPGKLIKVEQKPGRPDVKAIAELWARLGGKPTLVVPPDPESINLREALIKAREAREAYRDPDEPAGTPDDVASTPSPE